MTTITGTAGNDLLTGTADADSIEGFEGDDTLLGGADSDTLRGGAGSDVLYGAEGNDQVFLSDGDVYLVGPDLGTDAITGFGSGAILRFHGTRFASFSDVLAAATDMRVHVGGSPIDEVAFRQVVSIRIEDNATLILWDLFRAQLEAAFFEFDGNPLDADGTPHAPGVYDGTAGNDTLLGSRGADTLNGMAGDDLLDGKGGTDLIASGTGDDTIVVMPGYGRVSLAAGGSGNDTLRVGARLEDVASLRDEGTVRELLLRDGTIVTEDRSLGGSFNMLQLLDHAAAAIFVGTAAADRLEATAGNDILHANGGADTLLAGAGNDYLASGTDNAADDSFEGGEGTDTLSYSAATGGGVSVYIDAGIALGSGIGTDRFISVEAFTGSVARDVLIGRQAAGNDLRGYWGDDWLYGYAGNDALSGGEGVDVLVAGEGNDTPDGGGAQDYLYGGGGVNVMRGGGGVDVLISQGTGDTLEGGDDGDYLYAYGDGTTTAYGEAGNDIFVMQSGPGVADGGEGQDYFYMGASADTMRGGAGVDVLLGGGGNDVYDGGTGTDYLFLGAGNSTIVFRPDSGADVVNGFKEPGTHHVIHFRGMWWHDAESILAATYDYNGDALVRLDSDTVVWLVGVAKSQLTAADFAFTA